MDNVEPAKGAMLNTVKEIRLQSSIASLREEFFMAQSLVADGRIKTEPLHTSTVGLDGMGAAFAGLAKNPQEVKVLVDPRR